jgi:two-component system OmpR family sensor kinase
VIRNQIRKMARFTKQFNDRLHVVFAMLLLIMLALVWYFDDSVKWYKDEAQRVAIANNVLQGYLELSRLTYQELNALGDSVVRGDTSELTDWQSRSTTLHNAISRLSRGIAEEVHFDQNAGEGGESESLVEIEGMVEEIILASALISQALAEGRTGDASDELSRLRRTGVAGNFSSLIIAAIDKQKRKARTADQDAITLARYITDLLPVIMSVLVIITLLVLFLFSRSLARSVSALHEGARAFMDGKLAHRIPELREQEFSRLGEAFNTMALSLSDHRTRLHDDNIRLNSDNIRLEATVSELRRELTVSNTKLTNVDVKRRKLLADISHEFRTPLTVIRGESEIALRGNNKTRADYRESFQRIMDQTDQTTRLIDDLLFIARADAGEPRLKMRSVPIAGLIDTVCSDFGVKAEQRRISIEQDYKGAEAVVLGDSGRLRQVFAILMDNALRYSKPGGRVLVELSRSDAEVRISFRDKGIGLADGEAELAFDRFYRGINAEKHARGTGLGLPVAKAIVEAHNGKISLQGKQGDGATATITLPVENRFRIVA